MPDQAPAVRSVQMPGHPDDIYVVPCSCTHQFSDHVHGGNRCKSPDSYGCRCECPEYEPDPNEAFLTDPLCVQNQKENAHG